MTHFTRPTLAELASELRSVKPEIEDDFTDPDFDNGQTPFIEVRLWARTTHWELATGHPDYDTDHRGRCAAGYLTRKTNCQSLARELLNDLDL